MELLDTNSFPDVAPRSHQNAQAVGCQLLSLTINRSGEG
jgi:hypothetical protein